MIVANAKLGSADISGSTTDLLTELTLSVKAVSKALYKEAGDKFNSEDDVSRFLIGGIEHGLNLQKAKEIIQKDLK